eukprot:349750_1
MELVFDSINDLQQNMDIRLDDEERTVFHGTQILLRLQHIWIIYRDLKLQNVLTDKYGHCHISDLGLEVHVLMNKDTVDMSVETQTPGYTENLQCFTSQFFDVI